jgi:hypothetical protein
VDVNLGEAVMPCLPLLSPKPADGRWIKPEGMLFRIML